MQKDTKIAIIGGGISGLSVAYKLTEDAGFDGQITIFEWSETLGGNADTAMVHLGHDFRTNKPFERLADLGVNDINLDSYPRTSAAMRQIGYLPKAGEEETWSEEQKNLRTLEDTVCFFTKDGREIWTKDGVPEEASEAPEGLENLGVVDMRFSLDNPTHKDLKAAETHFMDRAAIDFADGNEGAEYWEYTTLEYVEYFRSRNLMKSELLDEVVRLFLLPRIAAMYFADEWAGPGGMPFRGVMSYYRLQEGYGKPNPTPDRRYFKYGSQHWINALASYLETEKGVKIVRNFKAKVIGDGNGGVLVYSAAETHDGMSNPERFDQVVMAGHADHQLESFAPGTDPLLTDEMATNLASIDYSTSISVAHTYSGVLPPNAGSWRTYNVMIRTDDRIGPVPYQMTYVQNRHRNDRMESAFNEFGLPVYFVSLNPEVHIPAKYILDVTNEDRARRIKERPGYSNELSADYDRAGKAIGYFRHTVMTEKLLQIQKKLEEFQGMAEGRVFFVGCWAIGAGLHEECFMQAERVKKAMSSSGTVL